MGQTEGEAEKHGVGDGWVRRRVRQRRTEWEMGGADGGDGSDAAVWKSGVYSARSYSVLSDASPAF